VRSGPAAAFGGGAATKAQARRSARALPPSSRREDKLATGLILLVFLGVLAAYGFARLRRRMGLAMTGQAWLITIAAMVLLGLAMWAWSAQP
jgi:hypothetical protein